MELKFEPVEVTGYTASKILAAEIEDGYLIVVGRSGAIAFVPKAPEFQALGLELAVSGVDEIIAAADGLVTAGDDLAVVAEEALDILDEASDPLDEDKPNGKAWKSEPEELAPVGIRLSRRGHRVHRFSGDATDALLRLEKPTACGKSIAWDKSDVRTTTELINCPNCAKAK